MNKQIKYDVNMYLIKNKPFPIVTENIGDWV